MTNTLSMAISFLILTSLFISISALTYIAHRHIESLESQLANCKFVQGNRSLYATAGMLGKTIRLCMIAGMLSTPNFYLRRNLADPDDIHNIPQRTKRVLLFFWYYLIFSASSLVISQGLRSIH
ncbi:hypothetical protein QFZ86_003786 [Pseudomonas plecoglossicida]